MLRGDQMSTPQGTASGRSWPADVAVAAPGATREWAGEAEAARGPVERPSGGLCKARRAVRRGPVPGGVQPRECFQECQARLVRWETGPRNKAIKRVANLEASGVFAPLRMLPSRPLAAGEAGGHELHPAAPRH